MFIFQGARNLDRGALGKVQALVQFNSISQMFIKQLLDTKHCLCPSDTSGKKTDKEPGLGQLAI